MKYIFQIFSVSVITAFCLSTMGTSAVMANSKNNIHVKDGWVRAVPKNAKTSAAYMVIKNMSEEDDELISASSPIARVVEIHNVRTNNGMMEMYPVDKIKIPANGSRELKMGSYHVMLINLVKQPLAGDHVKVKLKFRKAGEIELSLPVKEGGMKMKMRGGMNHDHHMHDH